MNIKKLGGNVLMNQAGFDGAASGGAADTAPGVTGTSDAAGVDDTFGSLMDDFGDGGEGGNGEVAPAPTPAAPAPAAPAPGEVAPVAAPAVAPVAPAPATPAAPTPVAAPSPTAAEPTPSATPEQQRVEARQQAYTALTDSWKKTLPPETVDAILTNPHETLPQIFAQIELRAMETSLAQVQQIVPQLIQQFVGRQQQSTSQATQFYQEYPFLKEHDAEVLQAVTQLKGLPGFDFSKAEVRKQVAGMVIAAKGLFAQAAGLTQAAPAAPTAQPRTAAPLGSTAAPAPVPARSTSDTIDWGNLYDPD